MLGVLPTTVEVKGKEDPQSHDTRLVRVCTVVQVSTYVQASTCVQARMTAALHLVGCRVVLQVLTHNRPTCSHCLKWLVLTFRHVSVEQLLFLVGTQNQPMQLILL